MNERRFNKEHLRFYRGILTSKFQNDKFKIKLKVEDNDILRRSKAIESSIELEFIYDYFRSPQFFHNIHSCQIEKCSDCENVRRRYSRFEMDLSSLQLGDTCEIRAALINNNCSELPREIGNFKAYEPLLVACPDYYVQSSLRLPDTSEGINKKYELEQQRWQAEREAEERHKADVEQAKKDVKKQRRTERIQQFFGESPIITTIIATAIGSVIAGIVLATIFNPIPRLFKYLYHLIFPS